VYCEAALRLLERSEVPYERFEYHNVTEFVSVINYRSVPLVFKSELGGVEAIIEENLIGGYDQLQELLYV
jgi:glutaredoxin